MEMTLSGEANADGGTTNKDGAVEYQYWSKERGMGNNLD